MLTLINFKATLNDIETKSNSWEINESLPTNGYT